MTQNIFYYDPFYFVAFYLNRSPIILYSLKRERWLASWEGEVKISIILFTCVTMSFARLLTVRHSLRFLALYGVLELTAHYLRQYFWCVAQLALWNACCWIITCLKCWLETWKGHLHICFSWPHHTSLLKKDEYWVRKLIKLREKWVSEYKNWLWLANVRYLIALDINYKF